jgi:outer membrane protein assembly factor BamB
MEGMPASPRKAPQVDQGTGYAANTAATDGLRVYAIFVNGDLAAFDYQGKRVWARSLGLPDNMYGHATSLLLYRNLLLVLFDQGDEDDDKGKLYAFDTATGRPVWTTTRKVYASWATPIIARVKDVDQVITCTAPWVIAYNAQTGEEIWRCDCLDGDVAPSPIYAGGFVLTVNTGAQLSAIRPDGTGDVSKTKIAWFADDCLPDITSPVSNGELVFLAETEGYLACFDLKNGSMLWEQEFDDSFTASPSVVGNELWLVTTKGATVVSEISRTAFKEIRRLELGEKVNASPAFLDGRIYMRGVKHLYCIGSAAP